MDVNARQDEITSTLFDQWLSSPGTGQLVRSLVQDAAVKAVTVPESSSSDLNNTETDIHSSISAAKSQQQVIPQFYFKNGPPPSKKRKKRFICKANGIFGLTVGLLIDEFKTLTKELCELPSFFSSVLYRKIDVDGTGVVTREAFIKYWIDTNNMLTMDTATRIYAILKQPDHDYLTKDDFKPILEELVASHEGLNGLQNAPVSREKYVETVIYRIFYYNNRSGNGRMTLWELKRGDLIATMKLVDEKDNINDVLRYFSYHHFVVIYNKFTELDTNRDGYLEIFNLRNYGGNCLSDTMIERIFTLIEDKSPDGMMSYEDFVYFILAEEHKSAEPSISYWFKCLDLGENGMITSNEMRFFYEEQQQRLQALSKESPSFETIFSQIIDMVLPENKEYITLRDLKRCKLAANVFNLLFSIDKFIDADPRRPQVVQEDEDNPDMNEWDFFARGEYMFISMYGGIGDGGGGDDDDGLLIPE